MIRGYIAFMRILVIEDEPGIANFVRQGLEEPGPHIKTIRGAGYIAKES